MIHMKYIFDFDKKLSEMSKSEFEQVLGHNGHASSYKKEIIEFITRTDLPIGYTTKPAYDPITREKVYSGDNCRHDDAYYWFETDIHCIKKYNIMPSDEFVQYVLDKTR